MKIEKFTDYQKKSGINIKLNSVNKFFKRSVDSERSLIKSSSSLLTLISILF